jgi:hypothetical protein
MDVGLLVGLAGVFVATLAGILGVWMERERDNPPYWAIFFSMLIVFASFIELIRTIVSAWSDSVAEDTMAQVLEELTEISERTGDPALGDFVGAELSRANPKTLRRVEKKMVARGKDPAAARRRAQEGRTGKARTGEGKAGKAGKSPDGAAPDGTAPDAPAPDGAAPGAEGTPPTDGTPTEGTPTDVSRPAPEGKAGKAGGEGKSGKGAKSE